MSERCERTSEWPSTLRIDFIVIVLNVPGLGRRGKEMYEAVRSSGGEEVAEK